MSPRAHPAGARVLRNKVTEETAGTHDWVQACRFSEAAGVGGARRLMLPQLGVVRFVFNTCTFQGPLYFDRTHLKAYFTLLAGLETTN